MVLYIEQYKEEKNVEIREKVNVVNVHQESIETRLQKRQSTYRM